MATSNHHSFLSRLVGTRSVRQGGVGLAHFLWIGATAWILMGYVWPTLNPVEVPALRASLDRRLFLHDFVVQESLRFTPRFYYNWVVLLPTRLGCSLAWSFALWQLAAMGLLFSNLVKLGQLLGLGFLAAAVWTIAAVRQEAGMLGATYFFISAPTPALWAMAVAVLGFRLYLQERAVGAYACFAVAALLQFHIGLYSGAICLTHLARRFSRGRVLAAVALWAGGMLAVFLPMRLTAATGTALLSNREFVEIYAQLRQPHHLVPSSWDVSSWAGAGLFYLGVLVCAHRLLPSRSARQLSLLAAIFLSGALLLSVNYFGVEVWPSALVAKLQPARVTTLTQLAGLAAVAAVLQRRLELKDYAGAISIGLALLSFLPGPLLILAGVIIPFNEKTPWGWGCFLGATAVGVYLIPHQLPERAGLYYGASILAILALLVPALWNFRAWAPPLCAAAALMGALLLARTSSQAKLPRGVAGHFAIDAPPFDVPGLLGQRLKFQSQPDDIVLVPPDANVWNLKLYADRAVVVDIKHFPFTDSGIREWKRRMDDVLGVTFSRAIDIDGQWATRSPAAIAQIAGRYGARYVLTQDRWHSALPGSRIDQLAGWSIWDLGPERRPEKR